VSAGFLLDTNVPSELTKPSPDIRVVGWVDAQDNASLHLSVVSVGELRRGFTMLPPGKRRAQLEQWFEQYLLPLFSDRILPVTHSIGNRWGVLDGGCRLRGTPLNTADGMIAATALEHDLTVVTRNVKDFAGLGVAVLSPWDAELSGRGR
jgi:predicted nucleic acid-binding protein